MKYFKPIPLQDDYKPSQNERAFAVNFRAIANLLENAKTTDGKSQSEQLALRLSTCRNGYLTVNALFVDMAEVFGHGRQPSLLSSSLADMERNLLAKESLEKIKSTFGKISENLSFFDEKIQVWEQREELDRILKNALDSLKREEKDNAKAILEDIRISDDDKRDGWGKKYYELSTDEPSFIEEKIGTLKEVCAIAKGIVDVGFSIIQMNEMKETPLLPMGSPADAWNTVLDSISRNAKALKMHVSSENSNSIISLPNGNNIRCVAHANVYDYENTQKQVVATLRTSEKEAYERLSKNFRPNIGEPPLPKPFRIDLSDPSPTNFRGQEHIEIKRHNFNIGRQKEFTIAIPDFGIPLSYYKREFFRFNKESQRKEVHSLVVSALSAAASKQADAIVFPEYFLPWAHIDDIIQVAKKHNIILIGGMEGKESGNMLENQAIIYFPMTDQRFFQYKHRNSNYEPNSLYSDGKHILFERTPIGNFVVIICSDFLEADIFNAISQIPTELHLLIVCSYNPHPEIFNNVALADSYRLYSYVVVANSYNSQDTDAIISSKGSIICQAFRDRECIRIREKGDEIVSLQAPLIAGQKPEIKLFKIDLDSLVQGIRNPKPSGGFLSVPHCRRAKPPFPFAIQKQPSS